MYYLSRYPRLTSAMLIVIPPLLLLVLLSIHVIPTFPFTKPARVIPASLPNVYRVPFQLSSDPYTTGMGQHQTEVEPDSYSYGSTIVAAFQTGRFPDGGSVNIGWATSTDGGETWTHGFLPGITNVVGGPFTRTSDPSVSYDAAHKTWLISSLGIKGDGNTLATPAILVNLSTDGGKTWSKPIRVVNGGSIYFDKDWIVCDNTATSPFYGHCYVEWDDDTKGGLILMSTSTNGGYSWSAAKTTANKAKGTGGQPLVQPNGTVIVPIGGYDSSSILSFTSTNGGASWSRAVIAARITGSVLPTAEIDASGKVYLVWVDCDFETICNTQDDGLQHDLEMTTSTDGIHWSPVQLIPSDPLASGIDHLVPGLAVDKNTAGSHAHLALAFYYRPTHCDSQCKFYLGFVASRDGGTHWTPKITPAGPMDISWLPLGRNKVGDYISVSFCNGNAYPVFSIAIPPTIGHLNEAMFTITGGLMV